MIAHDLWHVSLIRQIDVEKLSVRWEATASFTRMASLTVRGSTPDATLAALTLRAISTPSFMPPARNLILDVLASEMFRLTLMRPRQNMGFPPLWTATVWTRLHPAVSAVGKMPDEALRNLILMVNPSARR